MTRDEQIDWLYRLIADLNNGVIFTPWKKEFTEALTGILEQEPCKDAISRQFMYELGATCIAARDKNGELIALGAIEELPPVAPQQVGHCKECKYFEYDSVAKVDGIPLIVAHEICSKWGDGCKTKEDGYCFLFEPQESEGNDETR